MIRFNRLLSEKSITQLIKNYDQNLNYQRTTVSWDMLQWEGQTNKLENGNSG